MKYNIPYSDVNKNYVNALLEINKILDIEDDNYKFAKLVYNINPSSRFNWLEGKVDRYIVKNQDDKEKLLSLIEMLR